MATIKLRRADKDVWLASAFILADGEPGLASDTGEVRYGDGIRVWADLPSPDGGGGSSTVAGITDATATGRLLLKAANAPDARTILGAQPAGNYSSVGHTHDITNILGLVAELATREVVVRWKESTRTWEVRPAGAPFGVLFLSSNDPTATAPTTLANGQLTGDVWRRHPDAS